MICRRIIAYALLMLMLVIHMVKALHEHPVPVSSKHKYCGETEQIVAQHSAHCKICDFHLIGDSDVSVLSFRFLIPQIAEVYDTPNASFCYAKYLIVVSLRGPPISC
ncbi:hypothetical protein [Olivibacter jilunii]|jgi:hypothetical protein|uniref:Secreted protein n=1 Tax=Olivibacter oleidegradans TaxID=760123 RepID=A0ABV6HH56_9SPHI|nr:hypothetical protein [Olivibacter jilunii]